MAASVQDGRIEQMLLPVLLVAFGAAAGATLASRPLQVVVARAPAALAPPPEAPKGPAAPPGYLRLTVADVILTEGATKSAVLLTGPGEGFVLPLFIASETGHSLQASLDAFSFDALPSLAQAIAATGGQVVRVELTDGLDGPAGRIVISQDGEQSPLETGLDDALAVAVARGATVWVAPELVDRHAFQTTELTATEGGTASHLRPPEQL